MYSFGSVGSIGVLSHGEAHFVYCLERAAAMVSISISNRSGEVVYRGFGTKFAGYNEMTWNGQNNQGEIMPDGAYRITVKARDIMGGPILSKTYTTGRMTTLAAKGGTTGLMFGDVVMPISQVLAIQEPHNA